MQIDFDQYVDGLYRFALSLTRDQHQAEDLTQECCLRAHQHRRQVKDQDKIKSWLFQIMHNLWKDQLKKKKPQTDNATVSEAVSSVLSPEKAASMQEQHERVLRWMQQLPNQQRSVLFLCVVEGFKQQEVAQLLGISLANVKATLSIARRKLTEKVNASQHDATDRIPKGAQ